MSTDHLKLAATYHPAPAAGKPYSVPVPGSEQADRSAVYRNFRCKDGLLSTLDPKVRTGHDIFESTAARQPKARCFGTRAYDRATATWGPFIWEDYETVAKRRANMGIGLVEVNRRAGVVGEKYGVGLWCQNRPEWQITDLAAMSQSLYTVSLYDTLGPDSIEYIANHAELACIATSLPHIPQLIRLKKNLPHLKVIISLDNLDDGQIPGYTKGDVLSAIAEDVGLKLYSIQQVEEIGASFGPVKFNPPAPEDIITINYTSGTTGAPKGVLLTHKAAVAGAATSLCTAEQKPSDRGLSYLPLAHIYGRMTEQGAMWTGAAIGFFHGNIAELLDDIKELRPTGFNSVPRVYNRFGGAIRAATVQAPGFRGALSRHIVDSKMATLKNPEAPGATNKHAIYDRIWSRKVAAAIGLDKTRTMVSGSAPLDPSLQQFLRVATSATIVQGYGLTETYAVGLCQYSTDMTTGNCGGVGVATEMCLASVPDMDYLVTDKPEPRGELLMRGNTLFNGYYKNDEETSKAMTADGWFRTGDIASVDHLGRFRIIDRRKNVLKLAQGEYISPERIENVYLSHLTYLGQGYVHGDSVETSLVAIFGVAPELFAPFASKVLGREIEHTDLKAIEAAARDTRVRRAVVKDLDRVGTKNKFNSYEKVRAVALYVEPFTIENELLTPTLKLKRPQTAKKFRKVLDELYAESKVAEAGKAKM